MHELIPPSLRRLFRSRSHTLMVVLILAFGIGAVTAMWTVLDQVVLRPLPVREQDRLVIAWSREQVRDVAHFPWDGAMFEAAERGGVPAFADVAAVGSWGTGNVVVESEDGPITQHWAHTLGDFFGVLGVRPKAGRMLRPRDDVPAPAERVAVISDGLWASRWNRSPDAIGSALRTASGTFTVVGVAPAGFDYPRGAQVWVPERPFHPDWDAEMPHLELDLLARLAPGATAGEASEQLHTLAPTPEEAHAYANATPVVRPFADVLLGDMRSVLRVLFAGAVLVLLVAVLDVANLVLARTLRRRPEVAVRRALGADVGQLVREAASEAAWMGVGAAVLGAALAWIGVRALLPFAPAGLPRLDQVHGLDVPAYTVALLASALAVLAAVLLPLWGGERSSPAEALRTRRANSAVAARTRRVLVAGQVALTVWVLVVGVLMTRTLVSLRGLDLGFRADHLYAVALDYAGKGVEGRPGWLDRLEQAMDEMRHEPGVTGVTPLQMEPLPGNAAWQSIAYREGQTE